jgi:inorganic triphosphatase YgiF
MLAAQLQRISMPQEIEIRLNTSAADVAKLVQSPAMKRFTIGRPATARLTTLYYDTPDFAIAKSGLSLRVRKKGRSYVQTVKGMNAGTLVSNRAEWEARLPVPEPNLDAVADAGMRDRLIALTQNARVEPKIETAIRRTTRRLRTRKGDEIELAVDTGEIRTLGNGGEKLAVSEVELELKQGSPAALYEIARALTKTASVTVTIESKAERGLRALEGRGPAPHKSGRLELPENASAEEAFRLTLVHCLRHISENIPAVEARDAGGVHQIRVGLRRLRAALVSFGPAFRTKPFEELRTRAQALASEFGRTRELDVFALELLPPVEDAPGDGIDLAALRLRLETLRQRSWDDATALIRTESFTGFLIDLAAAIEGRAWRDRATAQQESEFNRPAVELARETLIDRHRKTQKRARRLGKLDVEQRHRLRIAMKKLRYAAEFFASLFPAKEVSAYLKQLSKTQDVFGCLNDVSTVQHVLHRVLEQGGTVFVPGLRESAAFAAGWHQSRVDPMWDKAKKRWKKLAKTGPFWAN